jgi:hypothetical protein
MILLLKEGKTFFCIELTARERKSKKAGKKSSLIVK